MLEINIESIFFPNFYKHDWLPHLGDYKKKQTQQAKKQAKPLYRLVSNCLNLTYLTWQM